MAARATSQPTRMSPPHIVKFSSWRDVVRDELVGRAPLFRLPDEADPTREPVVLDGRAAVSDPAKGERDELPRRDGHDLIRRYHGPAILNVRLGRHAAVGHVDASVDVLVPVGGVLGVGRLQPGGVGGGVSVGLVDPQAWGSQVCSFFTLPFFPSIDVSRRRTTRESMTACQLTSPFGSSTLLPVTT